MLSLLVVFTSCFISIYGHGYLYDPPARSTAWLVDSSFKQCCTYPNHMEMFCGGTQHQFGVNGWLNIALKIIQTINFYYYHLRR